MPGRLSRSGFRSEPLDGSRHDRASFWCGDDALDGYLRRQATQDVRKRVAAAFVLTPDGKTIAGYYTLSQYVIQLDVMPEEIARKFPKYPHVPATLIGRLARSTAFEGQGVGELLLLDAMERSLSSSKQIASAGIIVDAKNKEAKRFYLRHDFIELPRISDRLFLPMATVDGLFQRVEEREE